MFLPLIISLLGLTGECVFRTHLFQYAYVAVNVTFKKYKYLCWRQVQAWDICKVIIQSLKRRFICVNKDKNQVLVMIELL